MFTMRRRFTTNAFRGAFRPRRTRYGARPTNRRYGGQFRRRTMRRRY